MFSPPIAGSCPPPATFRPGWALPGALLLAALILPPHAQAMGAAPPEWPQFRGPAASGLAAEASFPVHFGPNSNVLWKVAVPAGNGSPSVWADRIFLTGAIEGRLLTLCYDRLSGTERWRREIQPEKAEPHSGLGSLANATPATDGERVYVYFGSFGLACYDVAGTELWRHPLPIPVTQHGAGTSPVLAGNLVLLVCDQDVGSYLLALDKLTGKVAWKTDRPGFRRGFSTPLPFPPAQPELAVVTGTLRLMAYDLADGSERWSVNGLPNEMVSSPVTDGHTIFAAGWTHGSGPARMGSYDDLLAQADGDGDGRVARREATAGPARQHFNYIDADKDDLITRAEWETLAAIFAQAQNAAVAVRPGGVGDVTESHVRWTFTRGLPYVPTPLVYRGRVYLVKDGGMLTCLDAETGQALYREERVGALGNYYASPVAAGDQLCVISQRGEAVVLAAGDQFSVLARNKLGAEVLATPAIVENLLLIRTRAELVGFGEPPTASSP